MKKEVLRLLVGISVSAMMLGTGGLYSSPVLAEESATESVIESEKSEDTETAAVDSKKKEDKEADKEIKKEKNDFVEGAAVLSDYKYEAGNVSEEGWSSDFLKMKYVPQKSVQMDMDQNTELETYYERNGKDKQVAASEFVAVDSSEGYVQIMVEVNPNHESEEDILERFEENEAIELASDAKEMEIAGKTFLTSTGILNKSRYLLGVCTDEEDVVIAMKVKYKDTAARTNLLKGFGEVMETNKEEEGTDKNKSPKKASVESDKDVNTEKDTELESETKK